jgi:hypothetical protein
MKKEFRIISQLIIGKNIKFTELSVDYNNKYVVNNITLHDYKNADLHLKMFDFENIDISKIGR